MSIDISTRVTVIHQRASIVSPYLWNAVEVGAALRNWMDETDNPATEAILEAVLIDHPSFEPIWTAMMEHLNHANGALLEVGMLASEIVPEGQLQVIAPYLIPRNNPPK